VACAAEGCGAEVTRLEHRGGGVYACRVKTPEAGVVTLSGHVGGLPVRGSPLRVRFDAGPTVALACAVCGDGWTTAVRVGVPLRVTVRARDTHGNAQNREGGVCVLRVTPQAHGHHAHVSAVERAVGVHECTYTLHFSGKYCLTLTLDGAHVPGSPLQIEAMAKREAELATTRGEQRRSRAPSASSRRGGGVSAPVERPRSAGPNARLSSRENRKKRPQWGVQFMGGGVQ